MVKLTDAILKTQSMPSNGRSGLQRPIQDRPRSGSQSRSNMNVDQSHSAKANSKKQAPLTITGDKLSLNYQDISSLQIDRQGYALTQQQALAFQFAKVKKLFLSHNALSSLEGIENFPNLTHLSLSFNKLTTVDELAKIGNKSTAHGAANNASKLQCLAVKGNYFLERHPDYRALIIRHFTGLRELDSQPIQPSGGTSQALSLRGQVREGIHLKHLIIPFLLKLDRSVQFLAAHLDGSLGSSVDKIELVQRWSQVFNLKDFVQRGKLTQRTVTASQLRQFIRSIDGIVSTGQLATPSIKVHRSTLFDLFQWLYQEIILKLSSDLKSSDLVKFLNLKVLQKYAPLADYLNVKNQVEPSKTLDQMDQRQVERMCTLLERDEQISLEVLLAEQLNAFYEVQPELSTLQDLTSELGTLQVLDEEPQPLPTFKSETTVEKDQEASMLATGKINFAANNATPQKGSLKSPSPTTFGKNSTGRMMLVQNSGSALDHPVILKNQKELTDLSMRNGANEIEFSFREKNGDGQKPGQGLQKFSPLRASDEKSMNDQSFLVESGANKPKHHDSPLRRDPSPVMKSFFKIKQTYDTEILPQRNGEPLQQPETAQYVVPKQSSGLKMNIPKNYFNVSDKTALQGGELGPDSFGAAEPSDASESFKLSNQDPIIQARHKYLAQPKQQIESDESRHILSRFLEEECDQAQLEQARSFLQEKVLTQFPIFALNEDFMRALTLIIMDKLERAQTLVQQISGQVYQHASMQRQSEQDISKDESLNLESSGASGPKRLTDAERDKLSLIKRKLQEKKLKQTQAQERHSTRSRSVTFSEQAMTKSRSVSRGVVSTGSSKDSCFSPANRGRANRRSLSRRSGGSGTRHQSGNRQQRGMATASGSKQRIYGSELLREQSLEHQRLTDEQSAQLWVKKKQSRQLFLQSMKRLCVKIDLVQARTKQRALYAWMRFAQRLHFLEHEVRERHNSVVREKTFFFLMAAFQQRAELTRGLRALQIKKKVWYQLVIHSKKNKLNRAKVDTYYRQKLLLKSMYGFLKIMELSKEQKRIQNAQKFKRNVSPPTKQVTQQKKLPNKKCNTTRNTTDGQVYGRGLVQVQPVIDKQIDGLYDLDVVDMHRQSYDTTQPLLNAVNNQPTFYADHTDTQQPQASTEQTNQHENEQTTMISFQDNFVHTNALLRAQKSKQADIPSAYFTKQVNFFKTGGSGTSFVQDRSMANSSKQSTKSLHSRHQGSKRSRSGSRNHSRELSLNRSRSSILKKVYGGGDQETMGQRKSSLKKTSTSNINVQADMSLENSFGKHMAEQQSRVTNSKPDETVSSYLDLDKANGSLSINNDSHNNSLQNPSNNSSKNMSYSRSSKTCRDPKTQSRTSLGPPQNNTYTEQSSLFSFRPSNVYTTQAKTKEKPAGRQKSNSGRMNCGNLSRSIKDSKPKGYEQATVSFVSKHITPVQTTGAKTKQGAASGNSQTTTDLFKHLKNASMGGSCDFFREGTTSASNKKKYQKLLVK